MSQRQDDPQTLLRELLCESDAGIFKSRLDALLRLFVSNGELTLARETCERLLDHADRLGLTTEQRITYQTKLLRCLWATGATESVDGLVRRLRLLITEEKPERCSRGRAAVVAEAYIALANILGRSACLDEADICVLKGRGFVVRSGELGAAARLKHAEGHILLRRRRLEEALGAYQTALSLYRLLDMNEGVSKAAGDMARVHFNSRRFREARRCFDTLATEEGRPSGRRTTTLALYHKGLCDLLLGAWDGAERWIQEALESTIAQGLRVSECRSLAALAELRRRKGNVEEAELAASRSLHLAVENQYVRERSICLEYLGRIAADRGEYVGALERFESALQVASEDDNADTVAEILRHKAESLNALGRHDEAIAAAGECLDLSLGNHEPLEAAAAHRALGVAHSAMGHREDAEHHLREAIEGLRKVEDPYEIGIALHALGVHVAQHSSHSIDLGRAADHFLEAKRMFERLGCPPWEKKVAASLDALIANAEEAPGSPPTPDSQATAAARVAEPDLPRAPRPDSPIVTRDPALTDVLHQLEWVAPSSLPILVTGERGTGKELVAHEVHVLGNRAKARFVAVNCAAIPTELQDSELFGHVRGAFTGAASDKAGFFEQADGGTIFLDEVGDLALEAQARLLRVLETGELRRVGDQTARRVDARVVAATNRDLRKAIDEGSFRADLFDRLDGFEIKLPPLRARRGDVPILVQHFLELYCRKYNKRVRMPDGLLEVFSQYSWPGNVRELRQEMHRLVLLTHSGETIDTTMSRTAAAHELETLSESARRSDSGLARTVDETEKRLILDALARAKGNKAQAARLLHMSRTTLIGKMRRHGIR